MLPLLLFVCFLALPIIEIYVILQIGGLIGTWPTVGLLIADSVLGAWVVRREGLRAWRAVRETLLVGRMPERELADAALILVGGALLLTPGFVTDAFGFLVVLPAIRPVVRSILTAYAKRRLAARVTTYIHGSSRGRGRTRENPQGNSQADSPGDSAGTFGGRRVIRGDVVDEEPRG